MHAEKNVFVQVSTAFIVINPTHFNYYLPRPLQEETAHFLPSVPETVSRSVTDRTFLDIAVLRQRITFNGRRSNHTH